MTSSGVTRKTTVPRSSIDYRPARTILPDREWSIPGTRYAGDRRTHDELVISAGYTTASGLRDVSLMIGNRVVVLKPADANGLLLTLFRINRERRK